MKKVAITLTAIALLSLPFYGKAQTEKIEKKEIEVKVEKMEKGEKGEKGQKGEKKQIEEIVIRTNDGTDVKLKVEINGDNITVNGKPLGEFKDDQVSVKKRKMVIRNGNDMMAFNISPDAMNFNEDFNWQWDGKQEVVIRPFLGVTTEKVANGAKITEVSKESSAEKAGLKKDDIITKVGEDIIKDGETLSKVIGAKKPKEVVKVTYIRNGKTASTKATLGERKIEGPMAFAFNGPNPRVKAFRMPKVAPSPNMDLFYDDIHDIESYPRQKRLGLKIQDTEEGGNVKVIDVEEGSAAEKAGLKKDDVITEIGGVKIENTDDARKQLMPSETKLAYTIKAKRAGTEMNFEVKFPKKLKTATL